MINHVYSILLLANDTYFKLLHICIKSICSVCDMEKVDRLYIADLGLRNEYIETLKKTSEKIEIINTNTNTGNSKELYSKDWIDAVSQKTAVLCMLVENNRTPVIMLDSDTIVVEDFSGVIDMNYDIQVCKRASPRLRPDGFNLDYIASFFIANNINAKPFITAWINRLTQRINSNLLPPHETPAMIETLQNNSVKIGVLDENAVSCENNYIKGFTKIIHAKSRNPKDRISVYRFANIRHLPYRKILPLLNNKKEKSLFTLVFIFKKLFPIYDLKQKIKYLLSKR